MRLWVHENMRVFHDRCAGCRSGCACANLAQATQLYSEMWAAVPWACALLQVWLVWLVQALQPQLWKYSCFFALKASCRQLLSSLCPQTV